MADKLAEVYEDAIDWMQRWQKQRDENSRDQRLGRADMAQIIKDAGKMNRELDSILKAYTKAQKQEAER